MSLDDIRDRIVGIARADEDVRVVVEFGSRARDNRPADPWSDLDLHFMTRTPARWGTSPWVNELGEVWVDYLTETPHGRVTVRRLVFGGALDVELVLNDAPIMIRLIRAALLRRKLGGLDAKLPGFVRGPIDGFVAGYGSVVRQGYRVLVDKDGFAPLLERMLERVEGPPTNRDVRLDAAGFHLLVQDFLYQSQWAAKKILRGEALYAKRAVDGALKDHLLTLLEDMAARAQSDAKVWSKGRFAEQWLAADSLARLQASYGTADLEGQRRALGRSMQLFSELAAEVAAAHAFPLSAEPIASMRSWLDDHGFDPQPEGSP